MRSIFVKGGTGATSKVERPGGCVMPGFLSRVEYSVNLPDVSAV